MTQKGRKSPEQVADMALVTKLERPDAPYDLSDDEAEEWRAIVGRFEPGWFTRETWPLLTNLCRLTVANRYLSATRHTIEKASKLDLMAYSRVLKMEQDNSRVLATLSTKLGLAQSNNNASRKRMISVVKPPWQK